MVGRWTSKDPVRWRGGLNLYGYADCDPVNQMDITGHDPTYTECTAMATAQFNSCWAGEQARESRRLLVARIAGHVIRVRPLNQHPGCTRPSHGMSLCAENARATNQSRRRLRATELGNSRMKDAGRELSFRVWLQTGAILFGVGSLFAALYVAMTGRLGQALAVGTVGLLSYGLATTPIPCPRCGHKFVFTPKKTWTTRLPATCPDCAEALNVAGVRPPLPVFARAITLITLTAVLVGSSVALGLMEHRGALTVALNLVVAIACVAQYFFIRIFIRRN